ncbi:hypothetical protein SAMN05192589_10247 [Paracidovorax valerianellae]|uniref:Transposase DDE domain-containing protein n=1 Tax=Paracidovorax valerianellae TaxID=187868 RepID=A0A1G6L1P7_9BURK|nr:hypothetical protein [Xanthomonas sp. 3075]SDC37309.1 hypothetical protein SAMN05192589_10247 [Paracidovorax valerianellae]
MTNALGNLVKFILMPGQRNDITGVKALIADVRLDALLADKAFDANWLIQELQRRGTQVVILSTPRNSMPAKTRGLRLMLIAELGGR